MTAWLISAFDFLLDIAFPGRSEEGLLRYLQRADFSRPLPYREPAVRRALWLFKYYGNRKIGRIFGGMLAARILRDFTENPTADGHSGKPLVIPIPSSKRRRKERGFDQTALLARFVGEKDKEAKLEIGNDVLYKIKDTKRQAHIKDRKIRLENQKDSMAADAGKALGRFIILIDDVMTTGATLAEGKRALLQAGAREVRTYCLCR